MAFSWFTTRDTNLAYLGDGTRYIPILALGLHFGILPPV